MANLNIPIPKETELEIRTMLEGIAREVIQAAAESESKSKDFMRMNEACAWLGISYLTMRKWQQQGLKCITIDGVKLIAKDSLIEFLKDHEA